jgi:hypothetical protein
MLLKFSCPECSSSATITLKDEEVESIKKSILEKGRSPTLLTKCDNRHELLVTLYIKNGTLGVRDVVVAIEAGKPGKARKGGPPEIDWVRGAFGGEEKR